MNQTNLSEELIKTRWDQANADGNILYRDDTLTTRTIEHAGTAFQLVHNGCRDTYDSSAKSIDAPARRAPPFYDGTNPELAVTPDGRFKILGNRFACMRYQSILAPIEPLERLTPDFLEASFAFAAEYSALTLMFNARNAGKTVDLQYWLLSFHSHHMLAADGDFFPLGFANGIPISKREHPCYMLSFPFAGQTALASSVLMRLVEFMAGKNFNVFLHAHRAFFIPRENVEIPTGFDGHRFGGLEMIGWFVMKSASALQSADTVKMLAAIREISFKAASQAVLESQFLTPIAS